MVESLLPTCRIPEQSKAGATSGCLVADALIGGDIGQAVKDEGVAWGKGEKAHLQTRRMYQPFLKQLQCYLFNAPKHHYLGNTIEFSMNANTISQNSTSPQLFYQNYLSNFRKHHLNTPDA